MKQTLSVCLLLLQLVPIVTSLDIGIGTGGRGGGIGIGIGTGGRGGSLTPNPPGTPTSRIKDAYAALQAWKSAITDDPSGILNTWVGSNVCSYKGVFCSDPEGDISSPSNPVVVGIDLNHKNLLGPLVKELSFLSDISLIHLNSNRFSGTIPDTFRQLTSLRELDLSNNQFSGPFPTVTLLLPNLLYLDLRFNRFSGTLPEDLFISNLDAIFLNNNQFQGQIPQSLGNSPASVINLANNKFTGGIPSSFGDRGPALKEVLFLNNQLTGCIPEGVGLLREMEVLDVSFNSLMGHLPNSVSCLEDIEVLNVAHNKLSGVLADSLCSLNDITNLTISYNFFSGFGQECTKLSRNVSFDFSGNCVLGKTMQRPQHECSMNSGGNCRIPSPRPLVCGSLGKESKANASYILG